MATSMNQAVTSYYSNYAQFQGRSNAAQYWWVALFLFIVAVVLDCLLLCCSQGSFFYWVWSIVIWLWGLVNLIPGIALAVRRLHDTGRGGGWIFINFLPIVGNIWFIVLMILAGEPNANRFGNPVK